MDIPDLALNADNTGPPDAAPAPELPEESLSGRWAVRAQTPEELLDLRTDGVEQVAGGVPAVLSALRHTFGAMSAVRGLHALSELNQRNGYDCPGCAWPDPKEKRALAEFCENGAKAIAEEATERRVTPDFFRRWSVQELSEHSDFWLGRQGRLTHPVVLREGSGHYQAIGWDEAFEMIAGELRALESPDQAIFYTSGRTSNEAAFLYQLFVRRFGTNNLPDCSNMCHESSGVALNETIGIGKGTVTLEDFERAEVILVVGQNPGTCHPRMLSALQKAVWNGCHIVAINPLPEAGLNRFKQPQDLKNPIKGIATIAGSGTQLAELHLPVRINGDVALLKGIMKEILQEEDRRPGEILAHDFIAENTEGFEEFAAALRQVGWEELEEESGIPRERMREVAELLIWHERIIVTWAMGLTQHVNAVANIQEIVNLLLMRGSIGKPGAGACPVRGHSNVQGDRTMGIWERPPPAFLDALERETGFSLPRKHGFDTVNAIRAMHERRARVFFAMGGNFLSATPDTEFTAEALRRCRLTVQVSTKLNRAHLVTGEQALILPCLGRTERDEQDGEPQFVTVENSMGIVHRSEGVLRPASEELLSEPAIVSRLATAVLDPGGSIDWEWMTRDYDRIRDLIERVIPGFDRYNERVRDPNGFVLPNAAREGRFKTPSGRARFTVHPVPRNQIPAGRYLMMTIRSHDQFNTTIYGTNDRYRGIRNERRVILLNAEDIAEAGMRPGDVVDLTSYFRDEERVARCFRVVEYPIPRGCAATYFPETNVLVPIGSVATGSNTPASKSVVIGVTPSTASNHHAPD